MSESEEDTLARYGCRTLAQGASGRVGIEARLTGQFDGIDRIVKARVQALMRQWCEGRTLPFTEFKIGGRFGKTAQGHSVGYFKGHQVRLYGFQQHLDGTRTFVICDCELKKKQNDITKDLNRRVKTRIDAFVATMGT